MIWYKQQNANCATDTSCVVAGIIFLTVKITTHNYVTKLYKINIQMSYLLSREFSTFNIV